MDFDRLTEFVLIAQLGGLSPAAKQLGISTATLSARLIQFERQLDTQLFTRSCGSLKLTPAGQKLLPSARELLARYREIHRSLHSANEYSRQRLTIAISGFSIPLHLGPFLDRINLTNPDIHLELLDDQKYGILDGLTTGKVDLYFAPAMEDFFCAGLEKIPIARPGQYAILPQSHPLAGQTTLSIRDLDGETFLLYPRTAEPSIRDFQLRNLRQSEISYSIYDSYTAPLYLHYMVPIGKGVILLPSPVETPPPNSVSIPITSLPFPAASGFFYDPRLASPVVRAFVRDFQAFIQEQSNEYNLSL